MFLHKLDSRLQALRLLEAGPLPLSPVGLLLSSLSGNAMALFQVGRSIKIITEVSTATRTTAPRTIVLVVPVV